ncbi:MAG: RagB/SusD family nutrient uptake outer membrane protein [Bacteroidales bacterium]|nr:RagB/SusD family nutrient uptake outer membrane protein [Bacteroidales bacterium]
MIKRIIILAIIFTGIISCNEDILDVENPNVPTQETFWKTADDAQLGLNAVYSQFIRVGNWSRWIYFRYDLTSDEGYSTSPWTELADWTRFNYVNYDFIQGGRTIYKGHYKQISECNQVIKFVPQIKAIDEKEQKELDQIVAQARFIRAFDYFNLVVMFGRLEMVFEPSSAGDNFEVADSEVVYDSIISDLQKAIIDLPEEWKGNDKGRVTKGAAYALLGKVYMQMHEWQKAKDAFQWLVEGEGAKYYGILDNYFDNFTHYAENNIESVFEIQFSDVNETPTDQNNGSDIDDDIPNMSLGNTRSQFFAPPGIGWADGKVRRWLVDKYKEEPTVDNLVNGTTIDDRLRVSIIYPEIFTDFPGESIFNGTITKWRATWVSTDCYFRKYGDDYFKPRTDYYSPINYRVIRFADVLLCYAECLAQLNDVSGAVKYVNMVRTRPSTNLPELASSTIPEIAASVNSKEAFLKRLQTERALELSLESVRWIDLKRWGLLDTQEGIEELKLCDPDFENFVIGKHNILPIPQFEVNNNPNFGGNNPNY